MGNMKFCCKRFSGPKQEIISRQIIDPSRKSHNVFDNSTGEYPAQIASNVENVSI